MSFAELERLVRRDPARRGLAAFRASGVPFASGELEAAARSIANDGRMVAIVTGFSVPGPDGWTAETDGPPGALYLAHVLRELGCGVLLVSDSVGIPQLKVGCAFWDLAADMIREFPFEAGEANAPARSSNDAAYDANSDAWVEAFFDSPAGRGLTHLIAIERAGPTHTVESLLRQNRDTPPPVQKFLAEVPPEGRNVCVNMQGESINGRTAKTHRLLEIAAARADLTTIGILDGGNEIGAGSIPWEVVREAGSSRAGATAACRIATNHVILAGVSNWGAYALAHAVCRLRHDLTPLLVGGAEQQRQLIAALVGEAGAVDGVTRLREATVDGLPMETYLQMLVGIRRMFDLAP